MPARSRFRARLLLLVAGAAALAVPAGAAEARDWPDTGRPSDGNIITIRVNGAPEDRTTTTVTLSDGSGDITAAACATNPTPDDTANEIVCFDLAEGEYDVSITAADPSDEVRVSCGDLVAARAPADAIPIGNGFTQWICDVWVGPPTVQLTGDALDPFDPVLLDADQTPVACTEERYEIPIAPFDARVVRWCPVSAGTYALDSATVDDVFAQAWFCQFRPFEEPAPDPVADPFVEIIVGDDSPFVSCNQQGAGRALLDLIIFFDEGRDRSWADAIDFDIVDGDGQALPEDCFPEGPSDDEQRRGARYRCAVPPGIVDFQLTGVPPEAVLEGQGVVDRDCEPLPHLPVGGQAICIVRITNPTAAPIESPDVIELPATGGDTTPIALLAAAILGLGITLTWSSRRPLR